VRYESRTGQLPPRPGLPQAKPSGDHIPLGGFVMSKKMTNSKAPLSGFRIVCEICDRLGIVFDCTEDAPSSTQINCRHCGAPRGTLGELRNLSAETCVAKK
jgi:ribosomal protein S27E